MGMVPSRSHGCGDSRMVVGSMICAKARRRMNAVGMAYVKRSEAILWIGKRVVARTDFSPQRGQKSRWKVVGQSLETDQPELAHQYPENFPELHQNSPLNMAHRLLRLPTSPLQSSPPSACLAPRPRFAALPKGLCGHRGLVAGRIPLTWGDPA